MSASMYSRWPLRPTRLGTSPSNRICCSAWRSGSSRWYVRVACCWRSFCCSASIRRGESLLPAAAIVGTVLTTLFYWHDLAFGFRTYDGGNDGLTHELMGFDISQAVDHGDLWTALRGGEGVFYFMPGLRYFRAAEDFLFGSTGFGMVLCTMFVPDFSLPAHAQIAASALVRRSPHSVPVRSDPRTVRLRAVPLRPRDVEGLSRADRLWRVSRRLGVDRILHPDQHGTTPRRANADVLGRPGSGRQHRRASQPGDCCRARAGNARPLAADGEAHRQSCRARRRLCAGSLHSRGTIGISGARSCRSRLPHRVPST